MKTIKIDIAKQIGENLKSRVLVRDLFDLILNLEVESLVFDFRNVSFASRSFMDEFFNIFLKSTEFKTKLIHLSPELQTLLDTVRETQHRPKNYKLKKNSDNVKSFSSIAEINEFLSSLSFL